MAAAIADGIVAGSTVSEATEHLHSVLDHKRKRDDDHGQLSNGHSNVVYHRVDIVEAQRDILQLLRPRDPSPSVLNHTILRDNERQPQPKKRKTESAAESTIAGKLERAEYASLADAQEEVGRVVAELLTSIRTDPSSGEVQSVSKLSADVLKQFQGLREFEGYFATLIDRTQQYDAVHGARTAQPVKSGPDSSNSSQGIMLTLFGNAPTPKQLFSSLQLNDQATSQHVKSGMPIDEMGLPAGLIASKLVSLPRVDGKASVLLGDTFAPPYTLPALQPPKLAKRPVTRDQSITWGFKDDGARPDRKGGYTVQPLPVGRWLAYGVNDSKLDPTSPREKRKQRDRALSSGEASQSQLSKASLADAILKEEEALFRRAYSSFAPCTDNIRSLVPEETRNALWWQRVGNRRYRETFALDPALAEPEDAAWSINTAESAIDDQRLQEIFGDEGDSTFDDLANGPTVGIDEPEAELTVDAVLKRASQLIRVLSSHQCLRNSTTPTSIAAARTPMSPLAHLPFKSNTPDTPTKEELLTYHQLRRELAYLVLRLPPYALAKLDGDQLADLQVSKMLQIQTRNVNGTMEEDPVARLARHTAMTTAAAGISRTSSSGNQHYSSTNQRTPAIGQAANTRYNAPVSYGQTRTPMSQSQQRPANSSQGYGTPVYDHSRAVYDPSRGPRGFYGPADDLSQSRARLAAARGRGFYSGLSSFQSPAQMQQTAQSTPQTQHRPPHTMAHSQTAPQNISQQASQRQSHSPFSANHSGSPVKSGYAAPPQGPPNQSQASQSPAVPQAQPTPTPDVKSPPVANGYRPPNSTQPNGHA